MTDVKGHEGSGRPVRGARWRRTLVVFMVGTATGIAIGLAMAPRKTSPSVEEVAARMAAADSAEYAPVMQDLVRRVGAYFVEHGGWIPADPIRALIQDGGFTGQDLRIGPNAIDFAIATTPVRISVAAGENTKGELFTVDIQAYREVWIAHLDGSWSRIPYARASDTTISWERQLRDAGYPEWRSIREKAEWLDRHRHNLAWNPARRMYLAPRSGSG